MQYCSCIDSCGITPVQIQVVNQATQFIQQAFEWRAKGSSEKIDKAQFRKAKCSLYLYYRCQYKECIAVSACMMMPSCN